MCKVWLTADVLCCTASILNLCAIALDRWTIIIMIIKKILLFRYKAVHDPINYATKRTKARVYFMIFLVWLVSCIICLPPLIGQQSSNNLHKYLEICRMEWLAGPFYPLYPLYVNWRKRVHCVLLTRFEMDSVSFIWVLRGSSPRSSNVSCSSVKSKFINVPELLCFMKLFRLSVSF